MTYRQKLVAALVLMAAAWLYVPVPAKAVATMFLGMAAGYFRAKEEKYD